MSGVTKEDCRKAIELFIEVFCEVMGLSENAEASYKRDVLRADYVDGLAGSSAIGREIRFMSAHAEVKLTRESLHEDSFYLDPCETDIETFEKLWKATECKFREHGLTLWRPET